MVAHQEDGMVQAPIIHTVNIIIDSMAIVLEGGAGSHCNGDGISYFSQGQL